MPGGNGSQPAQTVKGRQHFVRPNIGVIPRMTQVRGNNSQPVSFDIVIYRSQNLHKRALAINLVLPRICHDCRYRSRLALIHQLVQLRYIYRLFSEQHRA